MLISKEKVEQLALEVAKYIGLARQDKKIIWFVHELIKRMEAESPGLQGKIDDQAVEIAGLQQISLTMQASYESTITEYMKLNKELALLNRDLAGKMLEWKSLADQLGEALEAMIAYSRERMCGLLIADEALTAWRNSK